MRSVSMQSRPSPRSLPQLHDHALDLFLLFRQRFPLGVEQLDHGLQIGVLRLDLSASIAVAKHLLGTEQEVVALALAFRRGDARFEIGNLVVDLLQALLALLLFGAIGLRLWRLRWSCVKNRFVLMK